MRTRGIGTAGIAMPPRLAGSCGRSVFACPAGWRGRWPRGRGTWPFAVAPRAAARVVVLDDIGSPPDYARPEPTDAQTPVRSLTIAVPRLGRWYPAGPARGTRRDRPVVPGGTASTNERDLRVSRDSEMARCPDLATDPESPRPAGPSRHFHHTTPGTAQTGANVPGPRDHRARRCRGVSGQEAICDRIRLCLTQRILITVTGPYAP